jgi:hypothetical protein
MAKMGDLAAFKAAVPLLKERGLGHILAEIYRDCRMQLSRHTKEGGFVNHVKRLYEPFTAAEISKKIAEQVTPSDCDAPVEILYNSVEALHEAMPKHHCYWYFTGDYTTAVGAKVCCRGYVLWMDGNNERCYGVTSALSSGVGAPVLVIGESGGEHAIAWKLSQSYDVGCVFVAPGNGGIHAPQVQARGCASDTSPDGGNTLRAPLFPVDLQLNGNFGQVLDFCRTQKVGLVIVSAWQPLQDGLADILRSQGISVVGPSKQAAEIETSPVFAKAFMQRHGIAP